jgi:endonuclease III
MGAGRGKNRLPVIVAIIISQNAEDKDKNQSKIGKNKSDWN